MNKGQKISKGIFRSVTNPKNVHTQQAPKDNLVFIFGISGIIKNTILNILTFTLPISWIDYSVFNIHALKHIWSSTSQGLQPCPYKLRVMIVLI